tara:strand:+ start:2540 stop:3598 length:1059 start_codon:yes stop_codon:yes gene_type:complete
MKILAEYIWLGDNDEFRSKTRTVDSSISREELVKNNLVHELLDPKKYDEWNYDGSSTCQAEGNDSEVMLRPVAVYMDPFRKAPNVMVLCETYRPDGTPLDNNHRRHALHLFNKNKASEPWYGIEQEFYLMDNGGQYRSGESSKSLGFEHADKQGQYYCSVGSNNAFGRQVAERAYLASLDAGLNISGMNAEVGPGQWEIQVGPCVGIDAGDQVMMLRYLLQRVGELCGVQVSIHPKPLKGDWNGSGCHTNYSTKEMREKGGMSVIRDAIKKLEKKHKEHMDVYGSDNDQRMTGLHETASYDEFSFGVANRGASIRIPRATEKENKGYFEDRRPSSNMNPYLVTSKLFETTVL